MGEFAVPTLGRSSAAELLAYQGKVGTEHAEQPARRRYRVRGAAARAWFRERGYIASAAEQDRDDDLAVVAEELAGPRHVIRRVWHTAARVETTRPASNAARALLLLLHVDGETTVRSGTDVTELSPQDVVLTVDDRRLSLRASESTARIEVVAVRPPESASRGMRVLTSTPSAVAPALLAATVNTLLTGEGALAGRAADALSGVLDATIDLLLAENEIAADSPRSPERIYEAAQAFIVEWGHSPTVTSASVHEAMHVSRQYLARIFAAHGTTPGTELRRHRARLAHRLMSDGFMDATEIAAAAGFPSARTMRRVLRED